MHLAMLALALVGALLLRLVPASRPESWTGRWKLTLARFVAPPLVLVTTATAVLLMTPRVIPNWHNSVAALVAGLWLGWVVAMGVVLVVQAVRSLGALRRYPVVQLAGRPARLLSETSPFAAQVGFYHSELVVSEGLVAALSAEHLEAVLAHERAHDHYRDTFWFSWLGWLRRICAWLPGTESLWDDLITLREQRADQFATRSVDHLVLAEALLTIATHSSTSASVGFSAPFTGPTERLAERLEALLEEPAPQTAAASPGPSPWLWMPFALAPLASALPHLIARYCPCPMP